MERPPTQLEKNQDLFLSLNSKLTLKDQGKGTIQSRKDYFEARQGIASPNQSGQKPRGLYDYINGNVRSKLAFYESQRNKISQDDENIRNLLPPPPSSSPLPNRKPSLVNLTTKLEESDLDKHENHVTNKRFQNVSEANPRPPSNSAKVLTKTQPKPPDTRQVLHTETIGNNDAHIKTLIVYLKSLHNNLKHQDPPTQDNEDFLRYLQQVKDITQENQELKTELSRKQALELNLVEERLQAEKTKEELQAQMRISEEAYVELLDYCQKLAVEAQTTGKDVAKHQIFLNKRQSLDHLKLLQYQEKQIVEHREKLHQLQAEDVKHYRGKLQEAEGVIGEMKQKMLQFSVEYECAIAAYEEQVEHANKENEECKRTIEMLQAALRVSGEKVLESENRIHTFKLLAENARRRKLELAEEVVGLRDNQEKNCEQKICTCAEQIEISFPHPEAKDVKPPRGDKEESN